MQSSLTLALVLSILVTLSLGQTLSTQWTSITLDAGSSSPTYTIPSTMGSTLYVQAVRTTKATYVKSTFNPAVGNKLTIKDGVNVEATSTSGEAKVTFPRVAAAYQARLDNTGSLQETYKIRYCKGSCSSLDVCYRSSFDGFCYGQGGCNTNTGNCNCDTIWTTEARNVTQTLSRDCGNTIAITGLWESLFVLWIILIIVGIILALLPCIICALCCCGIIGAAAQSGGHSTVVVSPGTYQRA
eukprot:TRINITY_DN8996_c0_g1_i1.p1 TRINITY_DN8996_c0_g1~~TRINITY_DN8996_c0_g1_i1.p1  ORF type:complete len:242 (+),score=65.22 TRINITY_DN8996_c0_g1_i1:922-1647(+)